MDIRIEQLQKKLLIGKSKTMSLTENKTHQLWNSFMLEKDQITNTIGTDYYSIQVYDSLDYFKKFNPHTNFTKWAAIEVNSTLNIPKGFKKLTLNKGLYAVFIHKGLAKEFPKTAQYIYQEWLPNSEYVLEHRPHFEVLGEKYKNNDITSEEEVWIPIKKKP
ncbi:GyrI-like domain-containing protein [Kriegella sp. EG-1]|nr:GyrI-like domain-containing protein [Flavobacteriaceae bacterium EG-1]